MALFSAGYSAHDAFVVHSVRAGDAAEMLTRLNAEVAAAIANGESQIVDIVLAGAASGYDWECWFVTCPDIGAITEACPLVLARFACAAAGNPTEARESIAAQLVVIAPEIVWKIEVAGAGDGPRYMALVLTAIP